MVPPMRIDRIRVPSVDDTRLSAANVPFVGDQCLCRSCGAVFASGGSFDAHRDRGTCLVAPVAVSRREAENRGYNIEYNGIVGTGIEHRRNRMILLAIGENTRSMERLMEWGMTPIQ